MNEEILKTLNEAYVFICSQSRYLSPWRKDLKRWQKEVENLTGWDSFEEIEKYKKKYRQAAKTNP